VKYRIKREDKIDGTTMYCIESQLSPTGGWFYVERSLTNDLAVVQKIFANIKAGMVAKETILEEFGSHENT